MTNVLIKAAKDKNLQQYIVYMCGLKIEENDSLPHVICRKCKNFVTKMSLFRQSCQKVQVELHKKNSLKRLHLSPACQSLGEWCTFYCMCTNT